MNLESMANRLWTAAVVLNSEGWRRSIMTQKPRTSSLKSLVLGAGGPTIFAQSGVIQNHLRFAKGEKGESCGIRSSDLG